MKNTPDLFILAEHAELIQKLKAWDIAYHQNDAPIVDDATYDAVKKRALEIEELYPTLAKDGASTHVGAAVSEKFKSYLFLSLSNTCKKILSKNNYTVEFEDTGYTDSEIEFSIPVREALGNLDAVSREIVLLSVVGGFKSHEIGKITDMPSATVRTKLKRALTKLRKELE